MTAKPDGAPPGTDDRVARASYWTLVWRQLTKNRTATVGLCLSDP